MSYKTAVREFKVAYWQEQQRLFGKNVTKMARENGVNRTWLHKQLVKLGLQEQGEFHRGNWGD